MKWSRSYMNSPPLGHDADRRPPWRRHQPPLHVFLLPLSLRHVDVAVLVHVVVVVLELRVLYNRQVRTAQLLLRVVVVDKLIWDSEEVEQIVGTNKYLVKR